MKKIHFKDYAFTQVATLWRSHQEWGCLAKLWGKESAWNPEAANPHSTAFGIPQFLNQTWRIYGYPIRPKDPIIQVEAGLKYIKSRYKTPCRAWKHWNKKGYY
jgi:hypothetical protein